VLEHPWIAGATVRRLLPDRVRIHVREREPVGIVPIAGRPWAIDRRGRPVAPWTPTPAARLPLIAGVDLPAAAPLDVAAARMLRRVTGLLRALAGGHEVADLRIDAATGVTVRTRALGDVPIEFGWGHWERKRERFDAVMASWVGREADLRAVSVAIDDHVIVRLRPGAAAPPKPGGDAA
jgi:cell division protein FtsQ